MTCSTFDLVVRIPVLTSRSPFKRNSSGAFRIEVLSGTN